MGEFNLEKNLDVLADVITKRMSEDLKGKEKLEEEIKELEQINHEIIEKNKTLLEENKNLIQENKYLNGTCDALHKLIMEWHQENVSNEESKANKDILFYEEQNRKLLESNKSLVEEVERLRKENKYLERENAKLREIKGRHILDC